MLFQSLGVILPYVLGLAFIAIKDSLTRTRILLGIGAIFPLITLPFTIRKPESSEYMEALVERRQRGRCSVFQEIGEHLRHRQSWEDLAGTALCWFLYG